MYYITGDTHRQFERIAEFCKDKKTGKDDVLIILGDAGINYWLDERDVELKRDLSELPITLFSIHGNHEVRPQTISTYQTKGWNGGTVYYEEEYPNLLFAADGNIYWLNDKLYITIGGAYSVDKEYRQMIGQRWWADEQPSEETKRFVEHQLDSIIVYGVLSHTCPLKYEPHEVFLAGINQDVVDKSTEQWLDSIEERIQYQKWYCGHYHTDKCIDKMRFLFETIEPLE